MHFLFNLLRIKDLYMFRVLLAHLQELAATRIAVELRYSPNLVQPTDITHTQYTKCRLCSAP
jgi:hypothetical protein